MEHPVSYVKFYANPIDGAKGIVLSGCRSMDAYVHTCVHPGRVIADQLAVNVYLLILMLVDVQEIKYMYL